MKTRILSIIVIAALVSPLVWFDQAFALCMAEDEINWNSVLSESELVFTGTVTRLDNYDGPQRVTFFVHDVVKGEVQTPKHVLENSELIFLENDTIMSSSVNVDYKIGKTYKVFVTNGQTNQCTTKITAPPAGYIWEPGPEDGNYYSDENEEPLRQYQDANERKSYREALDSGSVTLPTGSTKLTDRELDDLMDGLFSHGLDHTELPIASIAIDYERDILVLWTPDLTIGNKIQELMDDVPFVLLYEEAPVRWTHDGPEPEPEQDRTVGKNCGPGTVMEDGICVVDESQKTTTDYSGKWDSYQGTASPLKQMQSGIKFHNVECREGLQLVYKKTGNTSACVTLFTEIELVVRGWATDSRVMLGCTGDRIQKCYPEDSTLYRNNLYEYYFGDGKGLPSSDSFDFDSLHTENACTDKPWICYSMFDNGTKTRIDCDYPLHGCGVKSFDSYKTDDDIPQWKKYITASANNVDHSKIPDSLPVYTIDDLSDHTMIETLLAGADGCRNETEVCSISRGISVDRMYSFGISVTDSDQYSVNINEEQAQELMSQIQWTIQDNLVYSVVSYNNEHYLLVLSTFDNTRTPDVAMRLIGVSSDPVTLKRDSILKYTIQLDTWATYGADAEITLDSRNSAKDSGIKTWVEPSTISISERSSVNATLFVQASETARDGIYDIRIGGKANGNNAGLHCGHMDCPIVQIGDSDWSIRTFGSDTGMGIGSGKPPENTSLEIELNKKEFFQGETVEIRAYLANNGTHPIVLDEPMSLLVKATRADSKGYYDHFYGIDARNESDDSIIVEPNSKILLVRPFYWDQMTFENPDEEHRIESGLRKMTATFVAEKHTWKDDVWFEIK